MRFSRCCVVAVGVVIIPERFVFCPGRAPDRHPVILGRAVQAGDDSFQFIDVLNHRKPAPIEAATGNDKWVFAGNVFQIG